MLQILLAVTLFGNLVVQGTAPTTKSICGSGIVAPFVNQSIPLRVTLVYFGPVAGVRMFNLVPGQPFIMVEKVPAGLYTVHSIVDDSAGTSCDTSIVQNVTPRLTVVQQ